MPTTSEGLPYPSSGDAPNVPQYIQNLAVAVDSKVSRFNFYSFNWPSSTVAGTNGINTNTITIPTQTGTYGILVSVGIEAAMVSSAGNKPELELYANGSKRASWTFTDVTSTTQVLSGQLSRSFLISGGASTTIYARVVIPANCTVTTYTDDTNSYLTAMTVAQ